ncbi:hypothetical protein ABW19_dt0202356 [Dactylella cylindrospora]|nr:hypothetical protein ABW19_dt0202356 [Dactylella cylindrospora]
MPITIPSTTINHRLLHLHRKNIKYMSIANMTNHLTNSNIMSIANMTNHLTNSNIMSIANMTNHLTNSNIMSIANMTNHLTNSNIMSIANMTNHLTNSNIMSIANMTNHLTNSNIMSIANMTNHLTNSNIMSIANMTNHLTNSNIMSIANMTNHLTNSNIMSIANMTNHLTNSNIMSIANMTNHLTNSNIMSIANMTNHLTNSNIMSIANMTNHLTNSNIMSIANMTNHLTNSNIIIIHLHHLHRPRNNTITHLTNSSITTAHRHRLHRNLTMSTVILPLPPMPSHPEHPPPPPPPPAPQEPPQPESQPFEPPMQIWDAGRFSPPPDSKPEARDWPTQVYENQWDQQQQDTNLFVPPRVASPPKNLHYELPPRIIAPPKPAPIFPWEQRTVAPATRVFAGDKPEPEKEDVSQEEISEGEEVEDEFETEEASSGFVVSGIDAWHSYSRVNAWDAIPAIEQYVASFQRSQRPARKGDLTPNPNWRAADQNFRDEEGEVPTSVSVLPPEISVTPTPFRSMRGYRTSIMDDESKFPSARGIPDQQSWNPYKQLEELKNAPREMLNKRSPPSPPSLTKGSPRSPSSTLVSSSMPVPEKDFHITAYQRRHERQRSISSGESSLTSSPLTFRGDAEKPESPWRPVPRRYTSSSTQTDLVETSDAETQSDPDEIDAAMEALSFSQG